MTPIKHIQHATANYYEVNLSDLLGNCRAREVVRPRQLAMALAYTHGNASLPEVGRNFRRDHTTVLHSLRRIREIWTAKLAQDALNIMLAAHKDWAVENEVCRKHCAIIKQEAPQWH